MVILSIIEFCDIILKLNIGIYGFYDFVLDYYILDLILYVVLLWIFILWDEMEYVFDYDLFVV